MSKEKLILRPLVGLMHGKDSSEIELFVVEEIEKHRRLRGEAVLLETMLETECCPLKRSSMDRAYTSAMIAVHAQQTVVSTLLDILGYIPKIPERECH